MLKTTAAANPLIQNEHRNNLAVALGNIFSEWKTWFWKNELSRVEETCLEFNQCKENLGIFPMYWNEILARHDLLTYWVVLKIILYIFILYYCSIFLFPFIFLGEFFDWKFLFSVTFVSFLSFIGKRTARAVYFISLSPPAS